MNFKDHFSGHAGDYARYRPDYPEQLFAHLAALAPACELAWDAGTGSGQAAHGLANHFSRVVGTDASSQQIERAEPHARVEYRAEPAERTSLVDGSLDLVTVAQALHWFDLERFYAEVQRVLKPHGVIAVWCYGLTRISTQIDPLIDEFYSVTVGPYWPPERQLIEDRYTTIPFPFADMPAPSMSMRINWTLEEIMGYLGTWSAVQRFRKERGVDPLPALREQLLEAWGAESERWEISWPIYMRVGRVG